ncbi:MULTISPECIES: ring-cleaving dioxygenase [unclassified Paenibacillus]|uniref:ring-cleaving dioxygenase n=1 Tax=unclassified Paenibacillus TaxID=185978 RepID=UPI001AE892CD|nr:MULTISPECIES: ring-cleaving dioxygenase [unclassified Paenibacillus]MBP1157225.1 glyoxalase family protein [Paenibacillus sp. PvP091]MBP1172036.1 glyoxalase family protein [Paenibacillus sp. PvR098]MBP2438417.1 glyoxalase family protein [Paenibacillus sp. PvP052]
MPQQTAGIHHITAFVTDAQENVDFYAGVLGLRLVKKTINFDAPEVYHLYFGNETGSPGTAITFFPWANARRGRIGGGQVGTTTFVVPPGALGFWEDRLQKLNISYSRTERFSEEYLQFKDSDSLQLELVEREEGPRSQWSFGGVTPDKAIKGFGGAVLFSTAPDQTMNLLEHVMGLEKEGEEGGFVRFRAVGDLGNVIDVNAVAMGSGQGGAGTVHHIAWRAKDDQDHQLWRNHILQSGFQPTPIVDRQYFNAIYFREEGGILFEIATDPPGFALDEDADALGEKLMLPEWFEPQRAAIEQGLPPIQIRVLGEDK